MVQSIQNFVESRKPRWERLEMLIKTLEHRRKKNQPAWDPLELARLYREATSDLARLQSFRKEASDPEDLEIYLNQLVGRAYGRTIAPRPPVGHPFGTISDPRFRKSSLRPPLGPSLPLGFFFSAPYMDLWWP